MPIVLISPEFTQEQYEETNRKLTGGARTGWNLQPTGP